MSALVKARGVLVLTVVFTVDSADVDAVADMLRASLEATRSEPGCVAFDVVHVTDDPTTFLLHEKWTDQAALDNHHATESFKRVGPALRRLMKSRTAYAGTPLA